MKVRFIINILIISCSCISCTIQQNSISTNVPMNFENDDAELILKAKEYSYVKLDCPTSESVIKHIDRVLYGNNMIYIIDRSKNVIMEYDKNGSFVASTKKHIGHAKNEYINILDVTIDENNGLVYAYADRPSKIMIFDKYLKLKEVIPTEQLIYEIASDRNNIYVIFYNSANRKFELRSYNKGNWKDYNVLVEQEELVMGVGRMGKYMTGCNDCCYSSMPMDNHIYKLKNGKIDEIIEVDFNKWSDYSSSKGMKSQEFLDRNINNIQYITNICSTDSLLLFNTNISNYYCINKHSLNGYIYKNMKISEIPFTSSFYTPVNGCEGLLIQKINANQLIEYKKHCQKYEIKNTNKKFNEILQSTKNEDNPLLIICKLR